jgi:dipeptidase
MCDTLVSLTDHGVLFAKNSDRDPNEAQVLRWEPAADHAPGAAVSATWIDVPQVAHTHAVVLSQPWWMWGAEMGANQHGVVIGNEAVFTRSPVAATGLLGMDLLRLALDRAATAHEAVAVLVDLLEQHGQGGSGSRAHPGFRYHNSFLVADPAGAIVLETADRAWATEEVSGPSRSISNGLTIEPFARAHADPVRGRVAQCSARRARTTAAAGSATGVADLFAALRDHGPHGSPHWRPANGALAAPCAHAGGLVTSTQTTASWVADLRGDPLHWVTATAAPCTSVFKPVRVDQPLAPDPTATDRYDEAVAWWRHERYHRLVLRDHGAAIARSTADRARVEAAWLADPPPSIDAFARAGQLRDAWLADLQGAGLPDRRPRWLRTLWRRWDRDAELPDPGVRTHPPRPAGTAVTR